MFKFFKNHFFKLLIIFKSQAFQKKPLRTIYYTILMLILLLFRIKINYKIKIKNRNFSYTFKPYLASGMGGRGQFIFREYYDPFLLHGIKFLPKNFNFIDIGCSRGFFTLFLFASNETFGKGVCIDPFEYALTDLKEIIRLNSFSEAHILKGVVSDKIDENLFLRNTKTPSEASVILKENFNDSLYSSRCR